MARIVILSPRETDPPVENSSFKARMPRYGTLSVAAHAAAAGHAVRVYDEFVGAAVDWAAVLQADVVCLSVMSFCAPRAYALAARVRRGSDCPIVLGGCHGSVLPEDALEHVDYVVRNEGEATLVELLARLAAGASVADVAGLSFRGPDGRPVHNPDRDFCVDLSVRLDLDLAPEYAPWGPAASALDALRHGVPRVLMPVVQASRGCPHRCRFCFAPLELGARYRRRPIDVVLDEIDEYVRRFRSPYLFFVDNDLTLDPDFSCELFRRILDRHGPHLRPWVFSRLAAAWDDAVMGTLNRFAATTLGVGIESVEDAGLRALRKGQRARDVEPALARLGRYPNLRVNGQLIFGGEHDTLATVERAVALGTRHRLYNLGMAALYDFPTRRRVLGHEQCIPDEHFIHRDWRFFGGNFVVHYPRLMRPSELQTALLAAFTRYYAKTPGVFHQYFAIRATVRRYIDYLRTAERDVYDARGRRRDEVLADRPPADLARVVPIQVPTASRYAETARFLGHNLTRPVAWDFARSLLRRPRPPVVG